MRKKHNPDLLDDQLIGSDSSKEQNPTVDKAINDQITTLQQHNQRLRSQLTKVTLEKAEMAGDVRSTVLIFKNVLEVLGIKPEDLSDNSNLTKRIPRILGSIATDIAAGSFNTQAVADIQSLAPLMDKYKYLFEDIFKSEKQKDE